MAKAEIKMPEDFLKRLSKLGNKTDDITEKVLNAGGEVVLAKVKSNLSSVIGRDTKYPCRPGQTCPPLSCGERAFPSRPRRPQRPLASGGISRQTHAHGARPGILPSGEPPGAHLRAHLPTLPLHPLSRDALPRTRPLPRPPSLGGQVRLRPAGRKPSGRHRPP